MNFYFQIILILNIFSIISSQYKEHQQVTLNAEQIVSLLLSQKTSSESSQKNDLLLKLITARPNEILHSTLSQIAEIESLELKLTNVTRECIQQFKNFTKSPLALQGNLF